MWYSRTSLWFTALICVCYRKGNVYIVILTLKLLGIHLTQLFLFVKYSEVFHIAQAICNKNGLFHRSQTRQTLATLSTFVPYNQICTKIVYLRSLLQLNECINNSNKNNSNNKNKNKRTTTTNNTHGIRNKYEWYEWLTENKQHWKHIYTVSKPFATLNALNLYPLYMNKKNYTTLTNLARLKYTANIHCMLIPLSVLASSASDEGLACSVSLIILCQNSDHCTGSFPTVGDGTFLWRG